jgi:hypothetical protein
MLGQAQPSVLRVDSTGHELPPELTINDVALAETLHLVDRQAAENWLQFLSIRKERS